MPFRALKKLSKKGRAMSDDKEPMCVHCGGATAIRNPTGNCDHLYWPDLLTDEAKLANGFKPVEQRTIVWMKENVTKEEMLYFLAKPKRY